VRRWNLKCLCSEKRWNSCGEAELQNFVSNHKVQGKGTSWRFYQKSKEQCMYPICIMITPRPIPRSTVAAMDLTSNVLRNGQHIANSLRTESASSCDSDELDVDFSEYNINEGEYAVVRLRALRSRFRGVYLISAAVRAEREVKISLFPTRLQRSIARRVHHVSHHQGQGR